MQKNNQANCSQEQINQGRRAALRKIAAGTVALAGYSVLPKKWSTPIIEFGALPAHAATSGLEELIEIVEQRYREETAEATPQISEEAENSEEQAAPEAASPETTDNNDLRGYSNTLTIQDSGAVMSCDGILQHKIVFSKLGPQYGSSLLLVWSDGNELSVPDSKHMKMNGSDYTKYQPGGRYSGNNPDIPTMEVYAKRGTHPSSVILYY